MALMVVWSHSFAIHGGSEDKEWFSRLLNGAYNAGNLGVMAFFIISGYLITQSYERSSSVRSYFKRRVRRIYPGYLVAISICTLVVIPLFATEWIFGPKEAAIWLGRNLLLQAYFPLSNVFATTLDHHSTNGSLWSILYEFWCYIGVAVLGAASLATKRPVLIGLTVFSMISQLILDLLGKPIGFGEADAFIGWPYEWTKMLPCFLLGMIAFAYRRELPRSRILLAVLLLTALLGCHVSTYVGHLFIPPVLAYAIFYLAFSDRIRVHDAAKYGDFSYGTYLYAFTIQLILQHTIGPDWDLATFFLVSCILSLVAAVLSWYLVEQWFMPRRVPRARLALPGAHWLWSRS
jgi:peptidoglycan/LPS O-acetylase OafA/YrhL